MGKRLGWYLPEQLILKITLAGSDPAIWRRVEVHSSLTLHDFHFVIQCVFGWTNSHLYQFLVPAGGKLTRRALADAVRCQFHPPDPFLGDDEPDDRPADEAILGNVLRKDPELMIYEYDFGDSWEHLVKVEKRTLDPEAAHIPVCLAGENAAPLDDSGGLWGYYDYVAALRDPKSELHEDAVDWLGKDFDPARFDLDAANRQLKAMFKLVPPKPKKPKKLKTPKKPKAPRKKQAE